MPRLVLFFLELAISVGSFVVAGFLYPTELESMDWFAAFIEGLVFLGSIYLRPLSFSRSTWVQAIERTSMGTGVNLLASALLIYTNIGEPASLASVFVGGGLAGPLISLLRSWVFRLPARSVLFLGYSPLGEQMATDLRASVWGVIDTRQDVSSSLPYLGKFESAAELVQQRIPRRIIIAGSQLWPEQSTLVEQWTKQGITVEDLSSAYEKLYLRVCSDQLTPAEILTSPALAASPVMMSLQATYSNLAGLAFLITLAPLLVVLTLLSRWAAGPGTMLDRVECAGFQGIPFQRLQFRTRSIETGELTWIGTIIATLHLTGLPQLINLVRGEMAMFGPAPARVVFSEYLSKTIPPYSHRLTMRPGVLGWARIHLRPQQGVREEVLQLEYDLYYITQCSPTLDFEILLRTMLRVPHIPGEK